MRGPKGIISHVTLNGIPLCKFGAAYFVDDPLAAWWLKSQCGYLSFNQAQKAARAARDYRVKAVKGDCPYSVNDGIPTGKRMDEGDIERGISEQKKEGGSQ